jgi:hypothetical protein
MHGKAEQSLTFSDVEWRDALCITVNSVGNYYMCLCIVRAIFVGLPNPGPRAMVGSRREVNKSQSLAAALFMHTPFWGGMRLKRVHAGRQNTQSRHHWLVAKALIKHVEALGRTSPLCSLEDLRASFAQRLRTLLEPLESPRK